MSPVACLGVLLLFWKGFCVISPIIVFCWNCRLPFWSIELNQYEEWLFFFSFLLFLENTWGPPLQGFFAKRFFITLLFFIILGLSLCGSFLKTLRLCWMDTLKRIWVLKYADLNAIKCWQNNVKCKKWLFYYFGVKCDLKIHLYIHLKETKTE